MAKGSVRGLSRRDSGGVATWLAACPLGVVALAAAGLATCGCKGDGASPPPGHAADGSVNAAPTCPASPTAHAGEGTYYNFADGSGNCMFPATPDDLDIGAMNHDDYAGSAACGRCAHVVGAKGELVIRIVDRCPECPAGNIDFSPSAFAKLDDVAKGRIPITWTYVACPVTGPLVYHFKDGSNPWWTAVQLRNHRYGIAKLEYADEGGAWVDVPRLDYNYFVAASGMGAGPYSFRVTDVNGAVIEDTGVPHVENGDSIGTHQFPACPAP